MNPTTTTPTTPPPALMTAEEFVRLHGDESGVELVKGRVVRYPMAGGKHGEVCGNAYAVLRDFVRPNGLGRVFANDTFVRTGTNPDAYRGADVCFLSYARLPKEQESPDGPLEQPPDLVIEVRSPTDRISQLTSKAGEYLEAGVAVVVVLDPRTESAAVYREDEFPVRLHNGDELTLPDVLPGFSVPVKKFFE